MPPIYSSDKKRSILVQIVRAIVYVSYNRDASHPTKFIDFSWCYPFDILNLNTKNPEHGKNGSAEAKNYYNKDMNRNNPVACTRMAVFVIVFSLSLSSINFVAYEFP